MAYSVTRLSVSEVSVTSCGVMTQGLRALDFKE